MKSTKQQRLLALLCVATFGLASCAISPRSASTSTSKTDRSARGTKAEQSAGVDEFNNGLDQLHQKQLSEAEKTFSALASANPT